MPRTVGVATHGSAHLVMVHVSKQPVVRCARSRRMAATTCQPAIHGRFTAATVGGPYLRPWPRSSSRGALRDHDRDHGRESRSHGRDCGRDHVVRPVKHTAETLGPLANRFNTQIRCSDLLDPVIYNQTHYTALIETTIHNDFAMFSEKEAKPIVAKRPFIVFGACRQLEALRSIGFRTFSDVIDESYDQIEDKAERWHKALDSMMALTEKDPQSVYSQLQDVLAHNKNHFENAEWKRCLSWKSYQ